MLLNYFFLASILIFSVHSAQLPERTFEKRGGKLDLSSLGARSFGKRRDWEEEDEVPMDNEKRALNVASMGARGFGKRTFSMSSLGARGFGKRGLNLASMGARGFGKRYFNPMAKLYLPEELKEGRSE